MYPLIETRKKGIVCEGRGREREREKRKEREISHCENEMP